MVPSSLARCCDEPVQNSHRSIDPGRMAGASGRTVRSKKPIDLNEVVGPPGSERGSLQPADYQAPLPLSKPLKNKGHEWWECLLFQTSSPMLSLMPAGRCGRLLQVEESLAVSRTCLLSQR